MKKILIIAILVSISFSNVVRAKEVDVWVAKEEYVTREMGVHADNFFGIALEYAEGKITWEKFLKAMDNRIEIIEDRFVGAKHDNQDLHASRLELLNRWKKTKEENSPILEEGTEGRVKARLKELAIEHYINSYGEMQQLEKRRQALEEAVKKMQQDKGGK